MANTPRYDRARPESAVAFFQPLADQGDPTAQTHLGEVYEYPFEEPKYQDAAVWYRKAADQGDLTATRRLAHLYEFGLGSNKTRFWRSTSGAVRQAPTTTSCSRRRSNKCKRRPTNASRP